MTRAGLDDWQSSSQLDRSSGSGNGQPEFAADAGVIVVGIDLQFG